MIRRHRRLHIVGVSPRTGTTLIHELMVGGFEIDEHGDHELDIFARPRDPRGLLLTKRPRDLIDIEPILRFWKELWVVCMMRDPRDVVVSKHGKAPDRYYVGLNAFKRREPIARRLRHHPRVLVIRYEDLVSDPESVQATIAERFSFLNRTRAFSDFEQFANPSGRSLKALKGVRPIDTASIGRWREHKPRVVYQIARHGSIDSALTQWGYEADASWKRELEGVEPLVSSSHLSERPPGWLRSARAAVRRSVRITRCFLGGGRRVDPAVAETAV